MSETNVWNCLALFLLKECYKLAVLYTRDEMAKNVLREKAKSIDLSEDYVPAQVDAIYQESEMEILSDAMYALTLEGNMIHATSDFKYMYKIDSLPESGEKEYLKALLSLRQGMSESNRIEALGHLAAALAYTPNDPKMITLARILEEV